MTGKPIEVSKDAEINLSINKKIVGHHRKEEQIKNIDHQDGKKVLEEKENVGNNVNEEKAIVENDVEKMEKSEKNLNQ